MHVLCTTYDTPHFTNAGNQMMEGAEGEKKKVADSEWRRAAGKNYTEVRASSSLRRNSNIESLQKKEIARFSQIPTKNLENIVRARDDNFSSRSYLPPKKASPRQTRFKGVLAVK